LFPAEIDQLARPGAVAIRGEDHGRIAVTPAFVATKSH
jgi:hypothetical protein